MSAFVTRFAPSPTGRLHRGHAFSAATAYEAARREKGRFLLRVEDIDQTRCRPEHEAGVYEDLAWLGLDWERPVRRQSEHFGAYRAALKDLIERGLVYRCFRTRKEILDEIARAPHGPADKASAGITPGGPLSREHEDDLVASGKPYAWRLSMERARETLGARWDKLAFVEEGAGPGGETGKIFARPETAGDVVLGRKDVGVAYHLAAAWDDALQGVTHVIRGEDLFEATHVQRLLQALLELPTPAYRHHRLLTDAEGRRYAKRDRAETLEALRARGVTPEELRVELGLQK